MIEMQFNGKLATHMMFNGNIIELTKKCIEYTIKVTDDSHTLDYKEDYRYYYLPEIVNNGESTINYRDIIIRLKDGTTTKDITTSASNVESIRVYYDSSTSKLKVAKNTSVVRCLDTENFTDMSYMFDGCSSLTSLDLSNFNTSNVTDMSEMFRNCSKLTSLDLSSFDTSNVTNMTGMFSGCGSIESLGLSNFNTSKVTSMSDMFFACGSSTPLDLSNWDTSSVTDMSGMFSFFGALTSLDLSSFDTSSVTDMSSMFFCCSSLESLDLSSFNTSKVTNMSGMFYSCESLTSLDLSNWDTSNVASMGSMFIDCVSLTSLDLSSFNTSNVTSMRSMFDGCNSLTSLDLSSFNTSNVTSMRSMFDGCNSLTSLDLSSFDTSSVTDMSGMFSNVPVIEDWHYDGTNYANWTLSESDTNYSGTFPWDIEEERENPYYIEYTIDGSSNYSLYTKKDSYIPQISLQDIYSYTRDYDKIEITLNDDSITSDLNTSASDVKLIRLYYNENVKCMQIGDNDIAIGITSINYIKTDNFTTLRFNSGKLTSLDLSNLNLNNLTNVEEMFSYCTRLEEIKGLEKINNINITSMYRMFYSCSSLESLDLSNFNTSKVTNMSHMFDFCTSLTSLDLSNWNTSKVTNMQCLFKDCSSLTSLDLSNFNTSNVTGMSGMFEGCSSLTSLDLSNFNTSNVTSMGTMFFSCKLLTLLDLSNFDTSNVTSASKMFFNVPVIEDWHYDGTNYAKWTLSESGTSYSGTFPWDIEEEYDNPYYIEYTVSGISGHTLEAKSSQYMPTISIDGTTYTKEYDKIEITLNDDSITSDLNVLAKDVKLIRLYYNENVKCMQIGTLTTNRIASVNYVKTDNFTSLSFGSGQLKSIDLSNLNLNNLTNVEAMFSYCSRLEEIKGLDTLDTSNVTNMSNMFSSCSKLTSLDLSNFNTSNVTDMSNMFYNCKLLTSLDLSNFDTSNVTYMSGMFFNVPVIEDWHYDGTNYQNWTLTESQTSFSGTFPWNE